MMTKTKHGTHASEMLLRLISLQRLSGEQLSEATVEFSAPDEVPVILGKEITTS